MKTFTEEQLQKFVRYYRARLEAGGEPALNNAFAQAAGLDFDDLKFIVANRVLLEKAAYAAGLIAVAG